MWWYDVFMEKGTYVIANTDIENEFMPLGDPDRAFLATVKAGTLGRVTSVVPGMGVWVDFETDDTDELWLCSPSELDIDNDD